jgi:alanyl-tRNA synthetase
LGLEVDQKGSLVDPDKLRFDFSHKTGVTDAELQAIETISVKYIKADHTVYSSDVDLATARKIQGVRAVFGETYPDPVRVVSVGKPVADLVKNTDSKEWESYSIEFCGGTHVERTGEIKELIITEESGIAKGIRRIVAVTGHAAAELRAVADLFEERLAALEKMAFSAEKDKAVKGFGVELGQLTISTLTKKAFVKRFETVSKKILKEQKEAQKHEVESILGAIKEHFVDGKNTTYVKHVQASSRAVADVVKHVQAKDKDKSVYLITADSGRVSHSCYVSPVSEDRVWRCHANGKQEHGSKGLVAADWSSEVIKAVGGKAGGKGATSVGSGTNVEQIDEGVELAMKHLEKLKIV